MLRISVNTSDLEKKLKVLSMSLNKDIETNYKELASLTASKLAYMCQPYGLGNKQRDILRKAILKDVGNSYWDVGRTANEIAKIGGRHMQASFLEAVRAADWARAEQVVKRVVTGVGAFTAQAEPGHLDKARTGPKQRVPKEAISAQTVIQKGSIDALKSKHVVTAGMGKAGWADVVTKLSPSRRMAKWLRQAGLGSVNLIKNGVNFLLSITNEVHYASALLSQADIGKAVNQSVNNHIRKLEKVIEATCNKV